MITHTCPNIYECWSMGTATFMIMGDVCTRACGFCDVKTGKPGSLDWEEPKRVAESVNTMGLSHAVITSVNRDDLNDGGSLFFAETIREVKKFTKFYNFIKGGNDGLSSLRRETMFINVLQGLHPLEAEILILVKDKDLETKYKISKDVVSQAYPDITWGGRS